MLVIILACFFNCALSAHKSIKFLLNNKDNQGLNNRIYISPQNTNNVDITLPTIFLAHGYVETANVYYYKDIPAEFLKKRNYNIIGLDWSELAGSLIYHKSVANTKIAGDAIGEMIVALHKVGLDLAKVHVIGHSLGGHVAGFAEKFVKKALNASIAKILAIDPAGPGFYIYFRTNDLRLSRNDALNVIVLHTDRTGFGLKENVGTVDFDANSGYAIQPGCTFVDFFKYTLQQFIFCSHQISVRFFTESINSNGFVAKCLNAKVCSNSTLIYGPDVLEGSVGWYRFYTNSYTPFAKN